MTEGRDRKVEMIAGFLEAIGDIAMRRIDDGDMDIDPIDHIINSAIELKESLGKNKEH